MAQVTCPVCSGTGTYPVYKYEKHEIITIHQMFSDPIMRCMYCHSESANPCDSCPSRRIDSETTQWPCDICHGTKQVTAGTVETFTNPHGETCSISKKYLKYKKKYLNLKSQTKN